MHLKVTFNWDIKPIYDVIARIPGSEFPDQWIIRGNHHDAWVNGAEDPLSGQVALLEEARSMSELLKQGWKPKRTIIFCAWDGEEPGLLGSTEWVETHQDELRRNAVMYINSDTNGRGFLGIEGSHSLEHFINGVARDVKDPETGLSVWKRDAIVSYLPRRQRRRTAGNSHAIRSAHRSPRLRFRLHARSSTSAESRPSTLASLANRAAVSITPSTTIFTGTRISAIPILSTAALWRRPPALR